MIDGLLGLDPAPLLAYAPLLFTFHFYEPYLFSHQGAPWMTEPVYKALNAVPWPASAGSLDKTLAAVRARMAQDTSTTPDSKRSAYAETERVLKVYFDAQPDRPYIDGYLGKVQSWCTGHGIAPLRVLLGEFGALGTGGQTIAAPRADRIRYIRDVRLQRGELRLPVGDVGPLQRHGRDGRRHARPRPGDPRCAWLDHAAGLKRAAVRALDGRKRHNTVTANFARASS